MNEDESKHGHEEEEEEAEVTPDKLSTTIFLIMTFLALVTVVFEKGKEYLLEDVADRTMKPVINSLFSELTVLGFLSLVTFVISQLEVLDKISEHVFGEGEERAGYLEELLEQIHFLIFAIMVIFILQSLILLRITSKQISSWTHYQKICSGENENKSQDIDSIIDWLSQEEAGARSSCCCWKHVKNVLLGRNERHRHMLEVLRFDAMREEFLNPRSQFPPFDQLPNDKLPDSFDYAKYMHKQLSEFLVEIIEVPVDTWAAVWVGSAMFCGAMIVTHDTPKTLAWIWAGIGWTLQCLHLIFQQHLLRTLSMCCSRKYMQRESLRPWFQRLPGTEMDILVKDDRPGWTALPMPDPQTRSAFEKCLFKGHLPTRQHLLFPFQSYAKAVHEFLSRVYLIFFTVYSSLLFFQFYPIAVRMDETEFLLYMVVAIEPLLYYAWTLPKFIQNVVDVNSLRVFKPSTSISTVLRDQKTERAIKALLLLNNMRNQFGNTKGKMEKVSAGEGHANAVTITPQQRHEIETTFDLFDSDGGGEIDSSEFRELMRSLGFNLSEEEAVEKLKILDEDNNGTISRDEFVAWQTVNLSKSNDDLSVEELVDQLFEIFDSDNDGEGGDGVITVQEFRDGLNRFNAGLSDEEVAMLLQELDEDGSGTIEKKEFKEMLEKYAELE